jgi:translation initiation factor IF-3
MRDGGKGKNLGNHLLEETKIKIGLKSRGRKMSDETKIKMSLSRKGKKFPHNTKIGKSNKGKTWEEIYGIEGSKKRRENIKNKKYENYRRS